jgi:hypothetical protein
VGGDQIEYPGDKSTHTEVLTTAKILINKIISTKGAIFLVVDIKNFYLNTPLRRFEYMVINLSSLPQDIIDEYGLLELSHDGRVCIEIQKGMYGLPQAGILTNKMLQQRLALDGYHPTEHTHGLRKHEPRPIWFLLIVDDFSIKYIGLDNAEHLLASIKNKYAISIDWTGSAYCGLNSIGIIPKAQLTYLYLNTSRPIYTNTNTRHLHVLNMHHTSGIGLYMVPRHSM